MPRIRTVKPELFKHEVLFDAERETGLPLRLAFIALFAVCDREGRFKWRPRQLKTDTMPYDEALDFGAVLDALEKYGLIKKYRANGNDFGHIPTWADHQNVNQRESASTIPAPPAVEQNEQEQVHADEESAAASEKTGVAPALHDSAHARTCMHMHASGEGKGKGREKEVLPPHTPSGCCPPTGGPQAPQKTESVLETFAEKAEEKPKKPQAKPKPRAKTAAQSPPTLAQVSDFFREILPEPAAAAEEAAKFCDHFASNGWKVGGKAPMRDWKAAGRNWMRNAGTFARAGPAPPAPPASVLSFSGKK